MRKFIIGLLVLGLLGSFSVVAQRADVDLDDDGLIEVFTLYDLDAMRNVLDGSSFSDGGANINNNAGCAQGGAGVCHGYELMADLDFDSNGNGHFDHNDALWNVGQGWSAIGARTSRFEAVFEGNFFHIDNLTIFRPSTSDVGLFGATGANAVIRNLILGGQVQVDANNYAAALIGVAIGSQVHRIWVPQAIIEGGEHVGGLIGSLFNTVMISEVQIGGQVMCDLACGGITGSSDNTTHLTDVLSFVEVNALTESASGLLGFGRVTDTLSQGYAVGLVTAPNNAYGLMPRGTLNHAHWDLDTTGQTAASFDGTLNNTFGLTTTEMQCPTDPDDTSCKPGFTLYQNWDPMVWDFGNSSQYPVLIFNGKALRDTDQDGLLDVDDSDDDNDGLDDNNDPNPLVVNDSDDDGLSDGLELATGTSPILEDSDMDGLLDGEEDINGNGKRDPFETDPRVQDTDGDTNWDVALVDGDGDGLVDIHTLIQLDAMRFNLSGTGRTLTNGGATDSTGCMGDESGATPCVGYELQADLDFDSNSNGYVDAGDLFWNSGSGWDPIGANSNRFDAVFEGNFHHINNLTITRPSLSNVGLFAVSGSNAVIRNLILGGKVQVLAQNNAAALVGSAIGGQFQHIWAPRVIIESKQDVNMNGGENAGGLIGSLFNTVMISKVQIGGQVLCNSVCGGITGNSDNSAQLTDVLSYAEIRAQSEASGLLGFGRVTDTLSQGYAIGLVTAPINAYGLMRRGTLNHAHWDLDTTAQTAASLDGTLNNTFGLTTTEMQCPTGPDDISCKPGFNLYQNWDPSIWNFGTETEYPVLRWTSDITDLIFRNGFE